MTNTKSTKRALVSSIIALLVCFTMLLGTTFAWFTDSVTSAGNKIMSGNLDVDLVDAAGNSMAGQIIEFKTADNRAQDAILWEPGCTYETEPVFVVNKGSLDLKYEMAINGILGNAKLLEAIEWTVTVDGVTTDLADLKGELPAGETSKAIVLSGHMKEEAGNEYQGLTAEGISITVLATQLASESDSFDNQYDAAAEYAAQTMLKNVAAVAAGESATVKLESDGYVVLNNTDPIGAKVVGDVTVDLNGKTLFVKVEDGNAHKSLFNIVKNGKLTVTGDGTIEMLAGANNLVTAIFNNTSGTLVIENGTYKMDHPSTSSIALIPTLIDNNGNAAGATTTINGGNFYHTRCMFRNFPSNNGITQLTINGGTFNGKSDDWAVIWNQKASASTNEGQSLITVNGGTFNYVEIDNEFNTGVTIADGIEMPVAVSTVDELTAALAEGGKVVLTADITGIDANTAITVAAGNDVTLDLNGHKLSATADKTGNQELFLVKGTMTVMNGTMELVAKNNQEWNAMATIFDVTAGGVLKVDGVTANVGGTDMNFFVHLNNWGAATLEMTNCDITTTYVAVRAFNSGYDMNTVTIKDSDFHGGRVFWVHNYTEADFGTAAKAEAHQKLLNLDIYNGTNTFNTTSAPARYGFTDSFKLDADGNVIP